MYRYSSVTASEVSSRHGAKHLYKDKLPISGRAMSNKERKERWSLEKAGKFFWQCVALSWQQ